uniref:Uncharacterized protein n=1 Tax=Moniliophthora roreri TaxID=221103 RepID=A0A0W0G017_MONRR
MENSQSCTAKLPQTLKIPHPKGI